MNAGKRDASRLSWVMRRIRSDRGSTLVEFAIVLPFLIVLSIGAADYGGAVNVATKLDSAARAGAQYGTIHPADTCGVYQTVQNATTNPTGNITVKMVQTTVGAKSTSAAFVTVPTSKGTCSATSTSSSYWWYCSCASNDSSLANAVDCNNSTTACGASSTYFYVAVQVSENYQPTLSLGRLPLRAGLPTSTIAMTGSATLQFQ